MKELLYFTAGWCSPCKALSPIMDELMRTYPIKKIDIEQQPQIARKYRVSSIPTTILLLNGEEIQRKVGVQSKEYYLQLFN